MRARAVRRLSGTAGGTDMGCAGSAPRPGLATPISDDVENNGYESTKLEAVETTAVVEHSIGQIMKHENSKNLSNNFSTDTLHQFHSDCDIIEDKLDLSIDSNTSETEENIFAMDKEVVPSVKVAFSDVINKIDDDIEINNEIKELETIMENVVMNDEVAEVTKEEKEEAPIELIIDSDEMEKEPEDVSKEDSNNNDKDSIHEDVDASEVADGDEESEVASPPSTLGTRRPTKWEALADVVAELPPRLSVDALTGQIFSAAKRD